VDSTKAAKVDNVALTFSGPGIPNFNTWATQAEWGSTSVPFLHNLEYVLTPSSYVFTDSGVGVIDDPQYGLSLQDTSDLGAYIFFDSKYNSFKKGTVDLITGTQTENVVFSASSLYLSPIQEWKNPISGFNSANDLSMLIDGSVVVADTGNDRIVQMDSDGNLVKALQGNIRLSQTSRDFAVLTSYYNPRLSLIYVIFSQNVLIKNSTLISIVVNNEFYQCGTNLLPVTLFSPLQSVSSTIEIQILDNNFNVFLSGIGGNNSSNFDIQIHPGAVEWVAPVVFADGGSSGGSNTGGGSNTSGGGSGSSIGSPIIMSSVPPFFINLASSGSFSGSGETLTGLNPLQIINNDPTDFPTGIPNVLDQTNLLAYVINNSISVVPTYQADITMSNIMAPTSIQVLDDGSWFFANSAPYSVMMYDQFLALRNQISRSVAKFIFGFGGSVYQLNDAAKTTIMALPAPTGGQGELRVTKGTNGFSIYFPQGDAVKALPDVNNTGYYVLLNDRGSNVVSQSQLIYLSTNGDYLWNWGSGQGSNILYKPNNMSVLSNGTIVISE
jgi:hypothetical protein